MPRAPVVAFLVAAVGALAAGCSGQAEGLRRIDALVAAIPRYPGAHLTQRQDSATDYKIASDRYVRARPYGSVLYYDVSARSGALEGWFRRVMLHGRFTCRAGDRGAKGTIWLRCRRGHEVVNVFVETDHYELDVWADDRRAPIPTVPGD